MASPAHLSALMLLSMRAPRYIIIYHISPNKKAWVQSPTCYVTHASVIYYCCGVVYPWVFLIHLDSLILDFRHLVTLRSTTVHNSATFFLFLACHSDHSSLIIRRISTKPTYLPRLAPPHRQRTGRPERFPGLASGHPPVRI